MTDQADQPDTRPISPLRQRMLEDMAMHGLRDATQRDYLRFVRTHPARAAVDAGRGFGDAQRFWSRLSSLRLSMPRAVNPSVARSSVS